MNKRFFLTWMLILALLAGGHVWLHGHWLRDAYAASPELADWIRLSGLMRAESDTRRLLPVLAAAHAVMALAIVWIYSVCVDLRPWVDQGVRFGLMLALLVAIPNAMTAFAVEPMSMGLALRQGLGEAGLMLVLGVVVAACYQGYRRKG